MSDDLISRKAAIDGFYEMASDTDHLCTVSDYVSFLESLPAIMQMPSGAVITDEMFDFCSSVEKMQEKINEIINSPDLKTSRIEKELHGKTPEEQYEFIYWLLFKSFEATAYSNSRLAIIDWLKGDDGDVHS